MIDLSGKKILVVGASSGIGAKTAQVIAEQGAYVVLVARREEKLKEVCGQIISDNKCYYVGDVANIECIGE